MPYGDRQLQDARFTPDGQRFVLGFRDGTIEVWSTDRRVPVVTFEGSAGRTLWSLDVTAGGRMLVALEDELLALGPWSVGL